MIERLTVSRFILVEDLSIDFRSGLNVLTGETGAGKSILVGALSLLLGAKGDNDLIMRGKDEAVIAGEFVIRSEGEAHEWLSSRGIEPDDGLLLIRRTLRRGGRGTIAIGGMPVARGELEQLGALLMDIHSQHQHQSLFAESHHRKILDRFAGIEAEVDSFGQTYQSLVAARDRLADLQKSDDEREQEVDRLRYEIEEITACGAQDGELEELESERSKLQQFERLALHIRAADSLLTDQDHGLVSIAKRFQNEIESAARIDVGLEHDANRSRNAFFELEDLAQVVARYGELMSFDPQRLEQIEERVVALRALFRKYGGTLDDVERHLDQAGEQVRMLEGEAQSLEGLSQTIGSIEVEIGRRATDLHRARREAADRLEERVQAVLNDLAMEKASFVVETATRSSDSGRLVCGPSGADKVRFLLSANPGEQPRPLSRVASGGELSRVMLAIKTAISEMDGIPSLLFDEVDTGVGGNVARAIGGHMYRLSRSTQVIAITHLATIAVRADNHVVVNKVSDSIGNTISVGAVAGLDREREISRMLAGDVDEVPSIEHARALLRRYETAEHHGKD